MAENSNKSTITGFDFGGYATKYNVKCSDGRTIRPNAFSHSDGVKIPLVWQHFHDDPSNVLGHVVLEHREDGVYARGKFNETKSGATAKKLVFARNIEHLSIYANQLVEKNKIVHSGNIREVSLVLSGANRGALIDHLSLQHADGSEEEIEDEAIIYTEDSLEIEGEESEEEELEEALAHAEDDETLGDVMNTLTEKQKNVVYAILTEALTTEESDLTQSSDEGEDNMKNNVFDNTIDDGQKVLKHDELKAIFEYARKNGSLADAVLEHAGTYGIDNVSNLFPDAKAVRREPDFITREMGWVSSWMQGVNHTPFSRIKSWYADLTPDAARAKGYVTGDLKLEQVFAVLKRTTSPTTIYKKQKLDRDDILDITDFDVVAWMKKEMRFMLDEEIGRACLVGDGRTFGVDGDAIDPSAVRPIYGDSTVYVEYTTLLATVTDYADIIDDIIGARGDFRGTGNPVMWIAPSHLTQMLLLKDTTGRRIYRSVNDLAAELRVSAIIEVEILEGITRTDGTTKDLIALLVNPRDYVIGADRGGQVNMFDDFDIDYNQQKYLIETRISGALTKPSSALAIEREQV